MTKDQAKNKSKFNKLHDQALPVWGNMWQEENPRYDQKQYIQGCPGGIEENTKSCISNIQYSSEYILEVIERFEKDKKHLVCLFYSIHCT